MTELTSELTTIAVYKEKNVDDEIAAEFMQNYVNKMITSKCSERTKNVRYVRLS